MKKFFKGLCIVISVLCVVFTAFFIYSYASGNIGAITKLEAGIVKVAGKVTPSSSAAPKSSTAMLTDEFGLSKRQAEETVAIMMSMGIDVSDPSEMSAFIAKNADHADEIREIAAQVQAGQITEGQAKAQLAGIVDV